MKLPDYSTPAALSLAFFLSISVTFSSAVSVFCIGTCLNYMPVMGLVDFGHVMRLFVWQSLRWVAFFMNCRAMTFMICIFRLEQEIVLHTVCVCLRVCMCVCVCVKHQLTSVLFRVTEVIELSKWSGNAAKGHSTGVGSIQFWILLD